MYNYCTVGQQLYFVKIKNLGITNSVLEIMNKMLEIMNKMLEIMKKITLI